jgi:hypothetical protein
MLGEDAACEQYIAYRRAEALWLKGLIDGFAE